MLIVVSIGYMALQMTFAAQDRLNRQLVYLEVAEKQAERALRISREIQVPSTETLALLEGQNMGVVFPPIPDEFIAKSWGGTVFSLMDVTLRPKELKRFDFNLDRMNTDFKKLTHETEKSFFQLMGKTFKTNIEHVRKSVILPLIEENSVKRETLRLLNIQLSIGVFVVLLGGGAFVWFALIGPLILRQQEMVAELKKSNMAANEAAKEARRATVATTQFLNLASHELRTPLNGVLGLAESIQSTAVIPDDAQAAREIQKSGLRLSQIVDKLIEVSDKGEDVDPVQLKEAIQNITNPDQAELPMDSEKDQKLPDGLRVLAADDNRTNRLVLGKILKKFGVAATFVEDGDQAVQAVCEKDYDVLLLDIAMPNMTGVEALEKMRAKGMDIPAIAVTANTLDSEVRLYRKVGFCKVVPKPVNKNFLFDSIFSALKKTKQAA